MQIPFFGLFKFSPFGIFSYLPPCERDGAQTVLPSGADLCRRVQRQPDTFVSLCSSDPPVKDQVRAAWDMRIIWYEAAHWNGPAHGDQTSP